MNRRERTSKGRGNWILLAMAVGILLIVGSPRIGNAQENLSLQLEELKDSAELALYFAKATMLAFNEADARINLQAILDLFDAPSMGAQPSRSGLIQQAKNVAVVLAQSEFLPETSVDYANAIASVMLYLQLADETAAAAQLDSDESVRASAQHAYAYLLAALGSDESGFGLAGIRQMSQWLFEQAIRISPSDSIQNAVESVLPGGMIYLAPGTYVLPSSLMIGKPLTLAKDISATGDVTLIGPDEGSAIYVGNDTPEKAIEIQIQDIHVLGGSNGITVGLSGDVRWGDNTQLTLIRVDLSDCQKSGLTVVNTDVRLHDCKIRGNGEFGILAPLGGSIEIKRCLVAENGTPELAAITYQQTAGIHALARAVFSIIDSTIEANAGSGIHVGSSVQLGLRRSRIIDNGGDGLLVWDQATVHIEENAFLNNMQMGVRLSDPACPEAMDSSGLHSFSGVVTGWENVIPTSSEIDGNGDGSICPLTQYRYLVEPPV